MHLTCGLGLHVGSLSYQLSDANPDSLVESVELPEQWNCSMNIFDKERSNCDAPQETDSFYANLINKRRMRALRLDSTRDESMTNNPSQSNTRNAVDTVPVELPVKPQNDENKAEFTKRDVILNRLLAPPEVKSTSNEIRIPKKSKFASKTQERVVEDKRKGEKTSAASIISKYYFHDALLKENS